jgi:tRNA(Met) cytidine acetyltransferase
MVTTGIRIVRISVHPAMQRRGYGTEAIRKLEKLETCDHEEVQFCGVTYELTEDLFRFWTRQGMKPVFISQEQNIVTGEHIVAMLRSFTKDSGWLEEYCLEFPKLLGRNLGNPFRAFPPELCDLIYAAIEKMIKYD